MSYYGLTRNIQAGIEMAEQIKDHCFQYASDRTVFVDSELITAERAGELWAENLPDFFKNVESESNPEMAIWSGMKDDSDFHTKARYLYGDDCRIIDGNLYVRDYT